MLDQISFYKIEKPMAYNDTHTSPLYSHRIYIECPNGRGVKILQGLYEKLKSESIECALIGGLNVELDMGWWRLRPSYSRNALVARCAAFDEEAGQEVLVHLRNRLLSFGLTFKIEPIGIWH